MKANKSMGKTCGAINPNAPEYVCSLKKGHTILHQGYSPTGLLPFCRWEMPPVPGAMSANIPLYCDPKIIDATRMSMPLYELMKAYEAGQNNPMPKPKRDRIADIRKWIGQHLHSLADRFWVVPYSDGEDW
jgi:hypothetical protein